MTTQPPEHLGDAGRAFFASATADFDLTIPEAAALRQAAETLDVLHALEEEIRSTGVVVNGKPSPLLVEARQQRAILVRLLGVLDLRLDEDDDPATSATRSARAAARARWNKQRGKEPR